MSFQDTLQAYHFVVPANSKFISSFAYTPAKKNVLLNVLDELRNMGASKELRLEVLLRYSDEYAKGVDEVFSDEDPQSPLFAQVELSPSS